MIGIILVIAYFDIKNRVARTHHTEATSIEKLSKDLETKFSFLSIEQAKIKDINSKKIPLFENMIAFLESGREEMSQAIETLNGKNQELSDSMKVEIETLKDIGNHMAKDVEDVSNNLYALAETLTEMKVGLHGLNADISNLSKEKIGKKELNLALKLKEISNRQELQELKTTLDNRIDKLKRQANNLQDSQGQIVAVQTIKGSKRSNEKPVQAEISPTAIPSTDKSEEQASSPSTIDGIIEQNIE
jgi:chromosome segregation ATPase